MSLTIAQTQEIQFRPYQGTDYTAIEEAEKEFLRNLYQLPTGGGKSVIIAKYILDRKDEKIIVFAHKRKLLTQLKSRFEKLGLRVGLLQGQNISNLDANIVIVSIRTAVKEARLEKLLEENWTHVIIDEARNSRQGSYDKVLDALKQKHPTIRFFGVDATPIRKDGKRLDKHFDNLIVSKENTATLIEKGYFPKYRVIRTPIGQIDEEVKEQGGDYALTPLSEYMRKPVFLQYVVNQYKEYGDNKQTIVFAVDKAHARDLAAEFRKAGYTKLAQIDSDLSDAEIDLAFEGFESGEVQILINVEMITEGVDLPNIGVIIGARPTKSLSLYLQMFGRARIGDDKDAILTYIDCAGLTEEFGTVSSPKHWSLNPNIDPNSHKATTKVVGRRKDGTYTEDLEDFIGEVVEMDPEEYMQHISGGLQFAEKQNATIDSKIADLFQKLYELLLKLMKNRFANFDFIPMVDMDREVYKMIFVVRGVKDEMIEKINKHRKQYGVKEGDSTEYNFSEHYRDYSSVEIDFSQIATQVHATIDKPRWRTSTIDTLKHFMQLSLLMGQLNEIFLENDKINIQSKELLEQMVDLKNSKINLNEFKEQAKKFEEEQFEKAINDFAAAGEGSAEFILNKALSEGDYFKSGSGYNRKEIISIGLCKSSVTGHANKIRVTIGYPLDRWDLDRMRKDGKVIESRYSKTYIDEKNYIKGDKIVEILKAGQWKADNVLDLSVK